MDARAHWAAVYESRAVDEVSWYQSVPATSLALIARVAEPSASVLDVGAGASNLVDELLARGFEDVTVLDVAEAALAHVAARLGRDPRVHLVASDLRAWRPSRLYGLWHDRAVLHFLTDPVDAHRYRALVEEAVAPGGGVVVGVFAHDGPTQCSGLEVRRYSTEEIVALLGPEFELVESRSEDHLTPAGAVQRFTWVALRREGAPRP